MNDDKRKKLEANTKNLLELLGEDPSREGLINTPKRVAKAWDFLTKGYTENLDELINNAIFEGESKDMVIVKNIEFYSLCEHHMIPFYGKAHIGYIPDGKIIGLSKLARITDLFSQRLGTRTFNKSNCQMPSRGIKSARRCSCFRRKAFLYAK